MLANAILAKIDLNGSCMPESVFYRVATYDRPNIALITDKQRFLCFLYYYVGANQLIAKWIARTRPHWE